MKSEKEIIDKLITTPYEKVLKKLSHIQSIIKESKDKRFDTAYSDLEWVIRKIKSHDLYSYSMNIDNELLNESNPKLKHLIDYIMRNSELSRNTFQRSDAYMKIRKGMTFGELKEKKKSLKANETQMKNIQKMRSKHFSNIDQHLRSRSFGNEPKRNEKRKMSKAMAKAIELKRRRLSTLGLSNNITELISLVEDKEKVTSYSNTNVNQKALSLSISENSCNSNNSTKSNASTNAFSITDMPIIMFDDISSMSFDIFSFEEKYGYSRVLPLIGNFIFTKFNLDAYIVAPKLPLFLSSISSGYHESSVYHNAIHGADVSQTLTTFFLNSPISTLLHLSPEDLIATFTASLAHDIGHPGRNNAFQINALTEIAIIYNDVSVLENFHCSLLFKILQDDSCNIFSNYTNLDFRKMRKRVINMILATDMFNHGKVFGTVRSKMKQNNYEIVIDDKTTPFDEQQEYLDCLLHIADISHNAKSFALTSKWVSLLNEEMLRQGDKEKELGIKVSYLCDRNCVDLPKSQIGFINAFIIPSFELLLQMSQGTLKGYLDNAKENLKVWERKNEEGKEKKESSSSSSTNDEANPLYIIEEKNNCNSINNDECKYGRNTII